MSKPKKKVTEKHVENLTVYFSAAINTEKFKDRMHYYSMQKDFYAVLGSDKENIMKNLQNWIYKYITDDDWSKAMNSIHQKKHAERANIVNLKIPALLRKKINECAAENNETAIEMLNRLVNADVKLLEYRKEQKKKEIIEDEKKNKIIQCNSKIMGKIFNELMNDYFFLEEPYEINETVEEFQKEIIKNGMICKNIVTEKLVVSLEIPISGSGAIFYGDDMANYVDEAFATNHLLISRPFFNKHYFIFGGMPGNVEAAVRTFKFLLKVIRNARAEFGKTISKRILPKNRQKRLKDFVFEWMEYIREPNQKMGTYDEYIQIDKFIHQFKNLDYKD